jgi:hypothetical protein
MPLLIHNGVVLCFLNLRHIEELALLGILHAHHMLNSKMSFASHTYAILVHLQNERQCRQVASGQQLIKPLSVLAELALLH